jgi:DNA-binding transcriptional ArsR family regulator
MAREVVAAGDVDDDQVYEALAHARRRHVLAVLADESRSLSLTDVARELARREAGDAVDEAEGGRADHISVRSEHAALADQLKITLHHRHVPKLEEAGLVDYDAEVKQVALDHLPPEVEPVVERTTA